MASGAIAGGGVSKTKHKRSSKRLKPTTAARLVSPSNSLGSDVNRQMMKISLNSISKLEVRNLKRKLTSDLEKVRNLINRLEPHKFGSIFNTPVDAVKSGLHDYHTIVKKPMDLGTVKTRLSKSWYESPLEFAEDVRLTFNNALLYNPVGHDVHRMAELLLSMFEDQYESLNKEASGNRDLAFEEKPRLSEDLQDLPFDKLEEVVEIIKKTKPELAQQDDEIELHIDSLDLETLWELYRFVTGYKESLGNKKEEQGLSSEREAESVHNGVQEPNTLVTGPESTKVTELGEILVYKYYISLFSLTAINSLLLFCF
ncbi:unnamed protein product [Brassica napus]|uniref:(rape) hypothetical protein n=1 Tax=Brassica napus TaxID=3708 RepID=A0A816KJ68_BRANA|nr:unnamed protein product [Brassica napus]